MFDLGSRILSLLFSQIPFLSLGDQVNQRNEIYRGVSDSTGEYVIEEVEEEESNTKVILRRLIFLANPSVIQSEARVQKGKIFNNFHCNNLDTI